MNRVGQTIDRRKSVNINKSQIVKFYFTKFWGDLDKPCNKFLPIHLGQDHVPSPVSTISSSSNKSPYCSSTTTTTTDSKVGCWLSSCSTYYFYHSFASLQSQRPNLNTVCCSQGASCVWSSFSRVVVPTEEEDRVFVLWSAPRNTWDTRNRISWGWHAREQVWLTEAVVSQHRAQYWSTSRRKSV